MDNQEVSRILSNMSSYLEMESGEKAFFRSRAFKRASEIILKFPYDLSSPEWKDVEKLKSIDGIGDKVANYIKEYLNTGKVNDYEKMKENSPVKLEELLRIQGLGPKTVLRLNKKLGVKDVKTLKIAAESGKIAQLAGFGEKSTKNILDSIAFSIINKGQISISVANHLIDSIIPFLKKDEHVKKVEAVGSYRRRRETIGDVDILVASTNNLKTISHFVKFPKTEKVLVKGNTKVSIWLTDKIQVDLRVIRSDEWGAALQYFTGSKEHNVKLRRHAIKKGYKLSEYGLFNRKTNKKVEGDSEKAIYNKLGLSYIPPELREDEGEIIAAENNTLPKLITTKIVKGDLQMHTTYSDGSNTISEMAKKGIELAYEYIGITDHLGALPIANPVTEKGFDEYLNAIKVANNKIHGIKILAGAEVEVDKAGGFSFDEKKLQQLDYIVAGVHLNTKMNKEKMTKRLLNVIRNPLTKILAHPTGRLIGQRPGYEFDYETVFGEASKYNVAIEINAHPMRLDISDKLAKLCKNLGCKIVINTDAHSTHEMDNMQYGIDVARRGWIEKTDLFYPKY